MSATQEINQDRDRRIVGALNRFFGLGTTGGPTEVGGPMHRVVEAFQAIVRNLGFAAPAAAILLSAVPSGSEAHVVDSTMLKQQAQYEQIIKDVASSRPDRDVDVAADVDLSEGLPPILENPTRKQVAAGLDSIGVLLGPEPSPAERKYLEETYPDIDAPGTPEISERGKNLLNAINGLHAQAANILAMAEGDGLTDRLLQNVHERMDGLLELVQVPEAEWTEVHQQRFEFLSGGIDLEQDQDRNFHLNMANLPGAMAPAKSEPATSITIKDAMGEMLAKKVAVTMDEPQDEAPVDSDKAQKQAELSAKLTVLRQSLASIAGNETWEDTQRFGRALERMSDIIDKSNGTLSEKSLKDIERSVEKAGEMVENFRASSSGSTFDLIKDDIADPTKDLRADRDDEPSQPFIGM